MKSLPDIKPTCGLKKALIPLSLDVWSFGIRMSGTYDQLKQVCVCDGQTAVTVWNHHFALLQHLHLKPHQPHQNQKSVFQTSLPAFIKRKHLEESSGTQTCHQHWGVPHALRLTSPRAGQRYEKCYWVIDRAGSGAAGEPPAHLDEWRNLGLAQPWLMWNSPHRPPEEQRGAG